jgi:hypothetical protein
MAGYEGTMIDGGEKIFEREGRGFEGDLEVMEGDLIYRAVVTS